MLMQFIGGGIGHSNVEEGVHWFENRIREYLGLEEKEIILDSGDIEMDIDPDLIEPLLLDDDLADWEDNDSEVGGSDDAGDEGGDSDYEPLEYLDEDDIQYADVEKFGYGEL